MSDASKAVFLSYASQDAEVAKRIADSLRAAGVEVWFDQNELVGGDAWDQKIRKQIKECALLIPIISAATQARTEGYFRLEWRLADQRTHLMAKGRPFLLPVVIDDTHDWDAQVPDSFTEVQWTRLPGGEAAEKFSGRVKKLLDGGTAPPVAGVADPGRPRRDEPPGSATPATSNLPRWTRPVLASAVIVIAVLGVTLFNRRDREPSANATKPAGVAPAAKTGSKPEVAALLARVRAATGKIDVLHTELDTMEGLLDQAAKLDPADAATWAQWAMLDCLYLDKYYDRTPARRDAARRHAAQAAGLDPEAAAVRLAQAVVMNHLADGAATRAEATKILQRLLAETPEDGRVLLELGWLAFDLVKPEASLEWFGRAAQLPGYGGHGHYARARMLVYSGRTDEAGAEFDRALESGRSAEVLLWKAFILTIWNGDLAAAGRALEEVPPQFFLEDMPAATRYYNAMLSRNYDQALAAARTVPHDYLQSIAYSGPTAYFAGNALALAGKTAAAELEWRSALATVKRRLAAEPNALELLEFKALLQAALGDREAGRKTWRTARELYGEGSLTNYAVALRVQLLPADEAFAWLDRAATAGENTFMAAQLRLDPVYDPLRSDPRFAALLAKAEADPRLSPKAKQRATDNGPLTTPAKVDEKSVAVLAFTNLSDDKGNEYFSDGISEELLNVLAKVPGLKVAARTSAFYFKGKEVPVPEIARQLGVAYVVEGSVRKAGDKVRITAQLIKAADGFHVWSDTFTRDLKDIFAVQDEIAGLIAKNLELKMGITAARPTIDLEAYQEYLAGRALFAKAGNGDLQKAVGHFEKAVAIEPKFTAAWVQLASAHTQLGRWGGAPTLQSWAAARAAIDQARALEPDSPDVLLALGWIRRTADWDWRGAEQAFRRSLQVRPDQPDAMAGLAVLLFNLGRKDEAFRLGQQAARLDPLNPATQIDLSLMFYLNDNLAEAESSARRALQLAPGGAGYHCILAWSLIKQGRLSEAEADVGLDSDAIEKPLTYGLLAIARGQSAVAREKLAELEEISRTNGDLADVQNSIAWLAVGLGEKDRPFAVLAKARDSRDPSNSWLRSSPYLDPLHSDPRWDALLRQVGLTDEQLK